jgi:hypothetical protein
MHTDHGTTETGRHRAPGPAIATGQPPTDPQSVDEQVLSRFGMRPATLPDDPVCVLPNCTTGVDEWGQVCDDCLTVFGAHLRPTDRPALTREQIAARDSYVTNAYALQQMLRGPQPQPATTPHRRTRPGGQR